ISAVLAPLKPLRANTSSAAFRIFATLRRRIAPAFTGFGLVLNFPAIVPLVRRHCRARPGNPSKKDGPPDQVIKSGGDDKFSRSRPGGANSIRHIAAAFSLTLPACGEGRQRAAFAGGGRPSSEAIQLDQTVKF